MVWTWVVHSILGLSVICSNAEICSSLPTAGGMFSWSYHLGGRYRRFWCWMTGNLLLAAPIPLSVHEPLLLVVCGGDCKLLGFVAWPA